jgi:hypothetical protein
MSIGFFAKYKKKLFCLFFPQFTPLLAIYSNLFTIIHFSFYAKKLEKRRVWFFARFAFSTCKMKNC